MSVSVIIPVYNRADLIEECIDSVLDHLGECDEVIVSDNHSTDGTWDVLQNRYAKNPSVILHRNETNLGPTHNWRAAFNLSSKSYVHFLWSDDHHRGNFLQCAKDILRQDPEIGCVLSAVIWSNKPKAKIGYMYQTTGKQSSFTYYDHLLKDGSSPVSGSCAMFRRKVLHSIFSNVHDWTKFEMQTGAGIDYLMFAQTFKEYSYFFATNTPFVFLGSGTTSITQTLGERLWFHYFRRMLMDGIIMNNEFLIRRLKTRIYYCMLVANMQNTKFQQNALLEELKESRIIPSQLARSYAKFYFASKKMWLASKFRALFK